jgi:hypothetical protein
MTPDNNEYVTCDVCGENLGDHKPYFAKEHLQKNQIIESIVSFLKNR